MTFRVRWRILYCMHRVTAKKKRIPVGFTLIELLVVIAIITLLSAMLIPALGKAFATAKSTEDKTRVKGIHAAMLLDATGNEGHLPLPSSVGNEHPTIAHDFSNTTANLMSMMVARKYFNSDFVISPVETNENVRDIDEEDLVYDFIGVDGETVFWDDQFNADISSASATNLVHNSYAHQALCGERIRLKWHSGATVSDLILSNRGPENSVNADGSLLFDAESNTLGFHGEKTLWKGAIVSGDGSTRIAQSYLPDGIAYQPLDGSPLGPDNIFLTDWTDIPVSFPDKGLFSGDNYMVISTQNEMNQTTGNIDFTAVWD